MFDAREQRAPVASNLYDESRAKEWVLFWKMTLFISCGLVEEAARLSLNKTFCSQSCILILI